MNILIKNGLIVTQNQEREITEGDIYIEDNIIKDIGEINIEAEKVINAENSVVTPGLINTHNHVAMSMIRGLLDDLEFDDFLMKGYVHDGKNTKEKVRLGAYLGCIEMVKTGTTTFSDLYYWEDEIAKVVQEIGMRGFLAWAILDEDISTQKGNPLHNCSNFITQSKNEKLIYPMVGVQGIYACSKETLLKAKDLADQENLLIHMHLSETEAEVNKSKKENDLPPVEYLEKINFLDKNLLAIHCLQINKNEVQLLSDRNVRISHCTTSSMKLGVINDYHFPLMRNHGLRVSLGTDGPSTNNSLNMFLEMKFCSLYGKALAHDPTFLPPQKVFDFATLGGAEALGMENEIGSIEIGKKADLLILDLNKYNTLPYNKNNILSHLVYSSTGENVDTVIIDGNIVMENKQLKTIDEQQIYNDIQDSLQNS